MDPVSVLPQLAAALDARKGRLSRNRSYADGNAPLPEMGKNTRASWEAFQKKARTNYGGLLCSSLGGRIIPTGVTLGTGQSETLALARRIWRDNRLGTVLADLVWDVLTTGTAYLIVGNRDGSPVVTAEKPEQVITLPDPVQPWRARAALKAWRDKDAGKDVAFVWTGGVRQRFERDSKDENGVTRNKTVDGWKPVGPREAYVGELPVFVVENRGGLAEFEPFTDTIDRINLGKLNRLVITAMQAFRQRALKNADNLPDEDDSGNQVNLAKIFEPAPGALWELPEGIDVWESQQVDITPLLAGEKRDATDYAAETQTPISVFLPGGENQSAEGAANAHKGEISRAKDRIARIKEPVEGALLAALRVLGVEVDETLSVSFAPPEHISFQEKASAASQAAGSLSRRWINTNIWGMSPDEIEANEADLFNEQLQAMTLVGETVGDST